MVADVLEIDRITPTYRPERKACGYHRWTSLLFAHWPVEARLLEPLLPQRLTVDTIDGVAWVGMVPFHMSGVRPRGFPAVPGISTFHETNIRTYVHLDGRDPGVWFFSLDAASSLAVRIARWFWHLPYYRSKMTLSRSEAQREPQGLSSQACDGRCDHSADEINRSAREGACQTVEYTGRRLWPGTTTAEYSIRAEIRDALESDDKSAPRGFATPGTFEHFLAERYIMYGEDGHGRLLQGRVHHTPYPLRNASVTRCDESLTRAAGIDVSGPPANVLFSEGVTVDVFPMRRVEGERR